MTPSNLPPGSTPPSGHSGGEASRNGEERFLHAVAAEVERRMDVAPPFDPRETLAELHGRLSTQATDTSGRPASRLRRRSNIGGSDSVLRRWEWVSAALLGVVAIVIGVSWNARRATPAAVAQHQYATTTGQRAVITLTDGTRVTMAPKSTLQVPVDFGATDRAVTLDGEAYFDVQNSSGTPFVVRADGVNTRVLGTKFFVRHYATDSRVRVAVTSGKVSLSARRGEHPAVTLVAGWAAIMNDSGATTTPIADSTQYAGWLEGRLAFHETPAPEVLEALSRWYGYQFRLADPTLAKRTLSVVLSTRSAKEALTTLKLVMAVDLTFDGNVITMTPSKGAVRAQPKQDVREQMIDDNNFREVGR